MENSGTVHNARVGKSYPVVIVNETSNIRIAIDSCNTVSGLCEIWKCHFDGFENVSKLIHCISELGELYCIVDYLKIVLRLILDGETALNAINLAILKARKNAPVVEPKFDIEGIIKSSKDLNILRQAHCHLVGSGKKASEYEIRLHCLLMPHLNASFNFIDYYRDYLEWLLAGCNPDRAIGNIISICEHREQIVNKKTAAKCAINTPPKKKIERGGFGKSAKSKKVMESDSVCNNQNAFASANTLQLDEKELGKVKLELCLFVAFVIIQLLLIFTVLRYIL